MTSARDGKYYAKNGMVWKAPTEQKTEHGSKISLGFPICKMHEAVGDEAASTVAELMNNGEHATGLVEALKEAERFMTYFAEGHLSFEGPGTPLSCLAQIRAALPPSPQETASE